MATPAISREEILAFHLNGKVGLRLTKPLRTQRDLCLAYTPGVAQAVKAVAACRRQRLSSLVVAGGVGANRCLRQRLDQAMTQIGGRVFYPALELCTDNGAMIAFCGAQRLLQGEVPVSAQGAFAVRPRWPLDQLS